MFNFDNIVVHGARDIECIKSANGQYESLPWKYTALIRLIYALSNNQSKGVCR